MTAEFSEISIQHSVSVRTAADDPHRTMHRCLRSNRRYGIGADMFMRTEISRAHIRCLHFRHIYNAEYGCVVVYECNIYGELAVARNKFLCAIERIHEPVRAPLRSYRERYGGRFFR